MDRRYRVLGCLTALVLVVAAASVPADEKAPNGLDEFARRIWQITNVVLDKHLEPPARQQMLLAGTRALLTQARSTPPPDLGQRFSRLTSREEFAALLGELVPKGGVSEKSHEAFLHGLFASVPGQTRLIAADEIRVMEQISGNRYEGTGIQIFVAPKEKLVQIVLTFPGSPARQAGMKAGDLILEVDGVSVQDGSIQKVVKLLRGEKGTPVSVLVRQPNETEPRKLDMIRGTIPFQLVVGYRRIAEGAWDYRVDAHAPIAYARVSSLTASTLHELRQLERRLQAGGFRALILDLRSAHGGDLDQAALVADGLLDGGLLWRTYDQQNNVREYRADRECLFRNRPLAVLVSGERHSETHSRAATMLAAALQDNSRAVLVGEPTPVWDGYIDSLVPLPEGQGALVLRIGKIERARPAATSPQVKPDHAVSLTEPERQAVRSWWVAQERSEAANTLAAPDDPQLAKAVDVLRNALKK